ncbi:MAG: hypothetical protein AAGI38_13200 [Bacteroidota bacterium]
MTSSSPNRTARQILVLAGKEPLRGHIARYGDILIKTWRESHEEDPPKVESEEPHGIFNVFSYPPEFQPEALQLLDAYYKEYEEKFPPAPRRATIRRKPAEEQPVRKRRRRIRRIRPE